MQLKAVSRDLFDDGWTEPTVSFRETGCSFPHQAQTGDTVLYRRDGKLTPAVLVEAAGSGGWLARDARHLLYLATESITARLPRMDLLEEAA